MEVELERITAQMYMDVRNIVFEREEIKKSDHGMERKKKNS